MPDAPGLELIRGELNQRHAEAVLETSFEHDGPTLIVDPAQILDVLRWLRDTPGQEYRFLASLHVADYLPAEPRFGVHYELLNMDRVERLRVRAALRDPATDPAPGRDPAAPGREAEQAAGIGSEAPLPELESCVELFPTADYQEREAYDMFGIVFRNHPYLVRILMPEDYVGWPQRRDYPVGGEPVLFTKDEPDSPGWYE